MKYEKPVNSPRRLDLPRPADRAVNYWELLPDHYLSSGSSSAACICYLFAGMKRGEMRVFP